MNRHTPKLSAEGKFSFLHWYCCACKTEGLHKA